MVQNYFNIFYHSFMDLWDVSQVVRVFKEAGLCTSRQGFVNKFNRFLRPVKKDGRGGKNFYRPSDVMDLVDKLNAGLSLTDIYGPTQESSVQENQFQEIQALKEEIAILKAKNQQLLALKDKLLEIIAQFGRE